MRDGGRTLIVTGASSGIGRALALHAIRERHNVVAVARRASRLDELARSVDSTGGSWVTLAGDVTSREMPARIVEAALRAFGRIDVVVNNAGRGTYGPLVQETDADIDAQWQLNFAAPLRLARAALPSLEVTRGQLVFIGSGIARIPLPNYGAYAPAKAAIRAAAIQLRRELRPRGIAVTYVDPGLVATEFHSAAGIERARQIPSASPQRVARAILHGIDRRAAVVHGVPWQSAGTVLGEALGTLVDPLIAKNFTPKAASTQPCHPEPFDFAQDRLRDEAAESKGEGGLEDTPSFEKALEPVARRMQRVNLSQSFLRGILVPGTRVELNALAMRWAGMPNKNERAALREALETLEASGYLARVEDETWNVVRAAD